MTWFKIVGLAVTIILTAGSWYAFRTDPRRALLRRAYLAGGVVMSGIILMSSGEGWLWLLVPVVLVASWIQLRAVIRLHREQNQEALEQYREKLRVRASGS